MRRICLDHFFQDETGKGRYREAMLEHADTLSASAIETLKSFAEKVRRERLSPVVSFFVESHRPACRLFSHGLLLLMPSLAPLFGLERLQFFARLLSSPAHLDIFLGFLEEQGAP